jgi:hypothetical protein
MTDQPDKPKTSFWKFWTTLPGVLTGLAALLSAVVGLATLFSGGSHAASPPNQSTKTGPTVTGTSSTTSTTVVPPDQHTWDTELNAVCREVGLSVQAREAAANVKPNDAAQLEIEAEGLLLLDRQIRASTAPPQDELRMLKMAGDWDNAAAELQGWATAQRESENVRREEREKHYGEDNELGNELAHGLGLDVCAATPA